MIAPFRFTWRDVLAMAWGRFRCGIGCHADRPIDTPYHVCCQRCGRLDYVGP